MYNALVIRRTTLADEVHVQLRKSLRSGQFEPGEVLNIRALGDLYGVSATPVREAIRTLVAEKSLMTLPNRSVAVPLLSKGIFNEVRQIRGALEGLCGAIATRRIDASCVTKVRGLYQEMEAAIADDDLHSYLEANELFHRTIYTQSGAQRLLDYIEELWVQVGPYFRLLRAEDGWYADANIAHGAILDAIEARDPEAVSAAVKQDIDTAAARVMAFLKA